MSEASKKLAPAQPESCANQDEISALNSRSGPEDRHRNQLRITNYESSSFRLSRRSSARSSNASRQLQQIKLLRDRRTDGICCGETARAVEGAGRNQSPVAQGQDDVRRRQNIIRSVRRAARSTDKNVAAVQRNVANRRRQQDQNSARGRLHRV